MNYDNTNAHKFDTNAYHAEGRSTLQMSNGAILSQNADGSHVGNVQPAISNAAVGVHGSDRVVDALHQSANESFSHASQLRTSADSHLQAGLSEMKNFTINDANDYRSGEGVSNTTTASIGQDLRLMKDAVEQHNRHADFSQQITLEAAVSGKLSTNRSLLGKTVEWVSGASGEASLGVRGSATGHHSAQKFLNTSEGKSFSDAYHHMLSTAKNSHLDASDTHQLSAAEQIAANFSSGESLIKQASAEYAHGQQLQLAASHAREEASTIDDNLNQAYHDWVVERHGAHGEAVMLQTDNASISTQHQWANEFLSSSQGQNAIGSQVKHALSASHSDLNKAYKVDAAAITTSKEMRSQFKHDTHAVDSKASTLYALFRSECDADNACFTCEPMAF